jgi:hypothetical protein
MHVALSEYFSFNLLLIFRVLMSIFGRNNHILANFLCENWVFFCAKFQIGMFWLLLETICNFSPTFRIFSPIGNLFRQNDIFSPTNSNLVRQNDIFSPTKWHIKSDKEQFSPKNYIFSPTKYIFSPIKFNFRPTKCNLGRQSAI